MAESASSSNGEESRKEETQSCGKGAAKRRRIALQFEEADTESPRSISEEDLPEPPRRGRGRGRGRGGQRGGRVFRGRQFEEGEEERLLELHEERKEKADNLIEQMTDDERKAILKEVVDVQPALILDVAAVVSRRQQQAEQGDLPDPQDTEVPSWCTCHRCPEMARDADKVCCGMAPQHCNSIRPEMGLSITDRLTLHIQQTFRNDVFAQQAVTAEDTNRAYRHAAYRQYVLWLYGRLQKDDRRTVPACCVKVIRQKFPSQTGDYTGFIPARHGVGW